MTWLELQMEYNYQSITTTEVLLHNCLDQRPVGKHWLLFWFVFVQLGGFDWLSWAGWSRTGLVLVSGGAGQCGHQSYAMSGAACGGVGWGVRTTELHTAASQHQRATVPVSGGPWWAYSVGEQPTRRQDITPPHSWELQLSKSASQSSRASSSSALLQSDSE